MQDDKPKTASETDCEVTVNDGSWMTCDMITDDGADTQEDGGEDTQAHGTAS